MPAADPDQFKELDARADRLRRQLESKPSLFDVLSPPPSVPTDPATNEDKKLKSAARAGIVYSWILLALGVVLLIITFGQPWGALVTPLMLIAFLGINAFTAIQLLRARTAALESELRQLRAQLESLQSAKPNDRSA